MGPLAARARFGRDVTRDARDSARRAGAGEVAADRHLRARGAAALLPARDDRGRAGRGKSRLCAELFGHLEDRPDSSAGARVVAFPTGRGSPSGRSARSSRRSAASSSRTRPRRRRQARASPALRTTPTAWLEARLRPARRRRRRAGLPGGVVHRVAPVPRGLGHRTPTRARVRGLHWADDALRRVPRASGGLVGGRAVARALHRPSRAVRAAFDLRGDRPGTRSGSTWPRSPRRRRPGCSPRSSSGRSCSPRRSGRCSSGRVEIRSTRRSSCAC